MNVIAALMTRLMPQGLGEGATGEAVAGADAGAFASLLGQTGVAPPASLPGTVVPAMAPDIAALLAEGQAEGDGGSGEEMPVFVDTGADTESESTLSADIAALVAGTFVVPQALVPVVKAATSKAGLATAGSVAAPIAATSILADPPATAAPLPGAAGVQTAPSMPPAAPLPVPSVDAPEKAAAQAAPLPAMPVAAAPAENAVIATAAQAVPQPAIRRGMAAPEPVAGTKAPAPAPVAEVSVASVAPAAFVAAAVQPFPGHYMRRTAPTLAAGANAAVGSTAAVGSGDTPGAGLPTELPSLPEATSLLSLLTPRNPGRATPVPLADAAAAKPAGKASTLDATPISVDAATTRDLPATTATLAPADTAPQPLPIRANDATQPTTDVGARLVQSVIDMSSGSQWIDGLAREIATMAAGDGRGSFRLSPEHLGPMRVDLMPVDNGNSVAIHLSVEVEEAVAILARESTNLKAEAQASGLRVAEVAVERVRTVHEPARADSGTQTGSQSQGQANQQSSAWTQASSGQAGTSAGQGGHSQSRKTSGDGAVLNHAEPRELGSDDAESGIRRARYA